jgi:NhaP-type Na+/H+ or K+/H+ antiporter
MTYIFLGLLIFCAHLFNAWFSRRRIPDVLLLVGIGILVGPVAGFITPEQLSSIGPVLSSLTLLFILFDSGIDMRLDLVRRYWSGVVQVTLLSYAVSLAAVTLVCYFVVGLQVQTAMMVGTMVAGTGASIVIPLVNQMRVTEKARITLTLESAISGVIAIVITLAFMEGFKLGNVSVPSMLGRVLATVIVSLIIGLAGGIFWSSLMERIRKLENSMFLTPAFVFVMYGVTDLIGFSGAIASLTFGLVLGNPEYFHVSFLRKLKFGEMTPLMDNEKGFFKEFVFILKTYFFVYIGISIPFTNAWAFIYGAIIAAVLCVVRFVLIYIVGRENTVEERLSVSILIPKGLIAAVLASIPEQMNAAAGVNIIPHASFIKHIVYAVIFCSIIYCSILVLVFSKKLMILQLPKEEKQV